MVENTIEALKTLSDLWEVAIVEWEDMAETILSYLLAEESSNPQRIRKGFRKKWAVWDQEKTASLLYPVGRGWRMGALTPRPLPPGTWPKASDEADGNTGRPQPGFFRMHRPGHFSLVIFPFSIPTQGYKRDAVFS